MIFFIAWKFSNSQNSDAGFFKIISFSALAWIMGKLLGTSPACTLCTLFNCYFSTLQNTAPFANVLAMLFIGAKASCTYC